MIRLTRINESPFYVNADLIEFVDETPDTVLTLTTGEKVRVRERAEEVVARVLEYRRRVAGQAAPAAPAADRGE
ncbi:MAG: flagellar FlbD family protein [Bryobacteraceae bacterium]|nr:flagellar FlbD family protein [Bryobacteraceae bacterium]MCX7605551.1 flagellar FlbD family protein [Bryobacteraceae bacterium]